MFICSRCGRDDFRSRQGLVSHQKVCNQAKVQETRVEDHRLEELTGKIGLLDAEVKDLDHQVRKLVEFHTVPQGVSLSGHHKNYFVPEGFKASREENPVVVLSARVTELSARLGNLDSQMVCRQQTFERELKGWIWGVIPEAWRPKVE